MDENRLKEMWQNESRRVEISGYGNSTLGEFLRGRSGSVTQKIKDWIKFDIVVKVLMGVSLIVNIGLYSSTISVVLLCSSLLVIILLLAYYEWVKVRRFVETANSGLSARENISAVLVFLKAEFGPVSFSMAITNLAFYTSGVLHYFYLVYGKVRPLDIVDILVFTGFYAIGQILAIVTIRGQFKYHIRHLSLILSDMNDNALSALSESIEVQRKQDKNMNILIGFALVAGFLALILILMKITGRG